MAYYLDPYGSMDREKLSIEQYKADIVRKINKETPAKLDLQLTHIQDPADFLQETVPKRQRLNSGTLFENSDETMTEETHSCYEHDTQKPSHSKGYSFLTMALGMMCAGQIVPGESTAQSMQQPQEHLEMQIIDDRRFNEIESDIEDKFVNMNLASHEGTFENAQSEFGHSPKHNS